MAQSDAGSIVPHLRWLFSAGEATDLGDEQLLERFLQERDEIAFAALVRRHGRLVLGVCRRVLRQTQDAEDVFQATFLILARRAASIRRREAVGSWLYQTAYRLSHKVRRRDQQRREQECQAPVLAPTDPLAEVTWREVREILDEELARLPGKYRAPLLMCCLEGRTQDEAARQLGWLLCTFKARLARGRELLRVRLARRGLPVGSTFAATLLIGEYALAHVPARIALSTCRAAALYATGNSIVGVVSAPVATLMQGALRKMVTVKIMKLTFGAAMLGVLCGGLGWVAGQVPAGIVTAVEDNSTPMPARNAPLPIVVPQLVDARGDALPPGAFMRLGTQRLRQGTPINSIAWSPDGKWIASTGNVPDTTVRLWDAATGAEKLQFQKHTNHVIHVAISPDGAIGASVDENGFLLLWETATGKVLNKQVMTKKAPITFSADGKSFASINKGGRACLLETATFMTLRTFGDAKPLSPAITVAWSKDNKLLATADAQNKVHIFDAATGKLLHTLAHNREVERVSFAPDGKSLATAAGDIGVHLWDTSNGKRIGRLDGHVGIVKAISWSPDGKTLASGSADNNVRLWDVEKRMEALRFTQHPAPVTNVAYSPDGKRVASAADNLIRIWDAGTGKETMPDEDHGRLAGMAVTADGRTLMTCGTEPLVRLWSLESGKRIGQIPVEHTRPKAIDVSPDGKLLAAGCNDGTIRLLEIPSGKLSKQIQPNQGKVNNVAFSPDGKLLASTSVNKATSLWDTTTGTRVGEFKHPNQTTLAVTFSPNGKHFGVGNGKGIVRIFDVETCAEISVLLGHTTAIERILFSPDGKLVTGVSHDSTVRTWDLSTGKEVRAFGLIAIGLCGSLTPGGHMLATGSGTGVIQLWELATGKQRATLVGHRGPVNALVILPDGKTLVTGSSDGTVLCWDLTGQGRGKMQPPKGLSVEALEVEWKHLHGDKVDRSYEAFLTLAANPMAALDKLRKELEPVPPVDATLIVKWVKDLNDEKFAIREAATAGLKKAADLAWPALREALVNPPSLDVRNRIQLLLGNQDDVLLPMPGRLRHIRSLELLERLGTPPARELARTLAAGAPDAWLTQESKAMVQRMTTLTK